MKYIASENFIEFVKENRDESVGVDAKGKGTSVKQEFVSLYKLCAQYVDAVNAYTYASEKGNFSADEAISYANRCDKTLEKAVKKLCFLNSVAKNKYDSAFLTKLINRGSRQSCNIAVMELFGIVNDILDNNVFVEKAM